MKRNYHMTLKEFKCCIEKAIKANTCHEAISVIKRFKSVKVFLRHPCANDWIAWYALFVIKQPWPEFEYLIQTSRFVSNYIINFHSELSEEFIKNAEKLILTNAGDTYSYMADYKGLDWKEGIEVILTSPYVSYCYAVDVIKGRWKEAEKIILTSPKLAYLYATHIIKGRWPEAEEIIFKSEYYRKKYNENLVLFGID